MQRLCALCVQFAITYMLSCQQVTANCVYNTLSAVAAAADDDDGDDDGGDDDGGGADAVNQKHFHDLCVKYEAVCQQCLAKVADLKVFFYIFSLIVYFTS